MRIGNINNLPWYARFSIFAGVALTVYAGFWYSVTSGTRKETRTLVDQIKVLQKANTEAQIAQIAACVYWPPFSRTPGK